MLNDQVKKGGVMASSYVGGLSGAFIPVSEDQGMIDAVKMCIRDSFLQVWANQAIQRGSAGTSLPPWSVSLWSVSYTHLNLEGIEKAQSADIRHLAFQLIHQVFQAVQLPFPHF